MSSSSSNPSETKPKQSESRFRFADALFLGLVVFFGMRLVSLANSRGFENDFAHYYVSSKAFLAGHTDIYRIDLGPQYDRLDWREMDEPVYRASNPPALLILFCAFAFFSPGLAFWLWMTTQIVCLVLIYGVCKRLLRGRLSDDQFKMVVSAFLVLPILEAHFHYSQVQLLLLVLVLFAFELQKKGRNVVSCFLICIATLLKLFPLVLLPWFIWRGSQTAKGRICLAVWSTTFLVGGLMATGVYLWSDFFDVASKGISVWAKSFPSYSISSFFSKFGIIVSGSNGSALTNSLFSIGLIVSLLLLATFYIWIFFKNKRIDQDIEFSSLMVLMLLCGTTCWLHYLVFIFFPICVAISKLVESRSNAKWATAGAVFLMLHTSLFVTFAVGPAKLLITNLPFIAMAILFAYLALVQWRNESSNRPVMSKA